ncbi:protein DA1-related 1-like [Olea europaea var. sylvestris]|uniref:protein DA1-related 1-like n=1 Tax=Olea europaea var. sylvestris TaxID=158386 RepID=UPI000C1D4CCA|nr:protein DA1-related 1-like [Olea europaea var. sylvestris]
MDWLMKILKGSSHKMSEGQYHGKYEDNTIWEEPPAFADEWSDFDREEIDLAIAWSLVEEDTSLAENDNKGKKEEDEKGKKEEDEKGKKVIDTESLSHLEEDELLAKAIQESLNTESPPRPYPNYPNSGYRICAGCKGDIGHGRYLSCMEADWHPECFRCHACNQPISDYEFSLSDHRPYHKSCYKEQHHPKCDVCKNFVSIRVSILCEAIMFSIRLYFSELLIHFSKLIALSTQVPMLLVERQALNEAMEGEKNGHHHMPETRGLCLSEEQTVSTILKRPKIGGHRIVDMFTEPYKLVRECEVTAILILYGLPRLLTGSILAHEMMHAWLRLKGYPYLSPEVEEGICQVLAHMWLDSEILAGSGSNAASTPSSSSSTSSAASSSSSSSKKGKRSQFEKELGKFFKHQIESDPSTAYGDGFREGDKAVIKYDLKTTLDHIQLTGSFPC